MIVSPLSALRPKKMIEANVEISCLGNTGGAGSFHAQEGGFP